MKHKNLFSQDKKRTYRFLLWRKLRPCPDTELKKGFVLFICFNPSTADETKNDQTLRRCIGFAESWGYGELYIANLFAFRARYTEALRQHESESSNRVINETNIKWLLACATEAALVVAAWGVNGSFQNQGQAVKNLLLEENINLRCLGYTKNSHPKHPLFVPGGTVSQPL